MIITTTLEENKPLTTEQRKMLEEAAKYPITFDEDCPELTDEQLKKFKRISKEKREKRRKQNVTLRLSYKSFQKAKSLGDGYTSVLSRILENALNDNDTIEKFL